MTEFTEIYDLFTVLVQDYKLNVLYNKNATTLNDYLQGFLLFAVDYFSKYCDQDLYGTIDKSQKRFNIDLHEYNSIMIARVMVMYWMQKEINNVTQFSLSLNDTDFKRYSEAQNLKSKQDRLSTICEDISQEITNYQLARKIDWTKWMSGVYNV